MQLPVMKKQEMCGTEKTGENSAKSSKDYSPGPDERFSFIAYTLEAWANKCCVISLLVAAAILVVAILSCGSPAVCILLAFCCIVGGYSAGLVMKALAVVVEAAYRSMLPKRE